MEILGATSIEKIPKIPLFEKGPYQRKRLYFVPNSNFKVRFFSNFHPTSHSPISSKSWTLPILLIDVAFLEMLTCYGKFPSILSATLSCQLIGSSTTQEFSGILDRVDNGKTIK